MKSNVMVLVVAFLALGTAFVLGAEFKVMNCAALSPTEFKQVTDFANRELPFKLKVSAGENASCPDSAACLDYMEKRKSATDAAVIGFVSTTNFSDHQFLDANRMVAVINVEPLACDDADKEVRRLQRLLLRSVAFLLKAEPAPDPHCVTHNYSSVEELDGMGLNYTPPYNDLIRRRAAELGVCAQPSCMPPSCMPMLCPSSDAAPKTPPQE